ncbi:MAG: FAD-binding oxidoreductase, partial [Betaproteobacteria bacterium]|nr:FAD-binding oxidoreductase [Betaproteobacteria bacterium]
MQLPPYETIQREAASFIPAARLITDPLRRLAWGTDGSFYRLIPQLVVVVDSEDEVAKMLALCAHYRAPVTFRAAGTSLSGQAVTDSVLLLLGDNWRRIRVSDDGTLIHLQPGVIGAAANRRLAPLGRKIGPDPASIDTAMIGGIAANNASGMCCGTAQNSYQTVHGMRVILADGSVLDTRDPASRSHFLAVKAEFVARLDALARATRANEALAARIRHKFRMKNTTGYSLNALVDFEDPLDILAHLMIGSEGTLGFIAELSYRTVPEYADKASALILYHDLKTACEAVQLLKTTPVSAVELADRPALRSVQGKPGLPAGIQDLGPDGAAILVETRAADAAELARQIAQIEERLRPLATAQPIAFTADPVEIARYWSVRKGMFPSVGAVRKVGTTVVIEDVAFPVPRLAEATLDLQALLREHGYHEAIIFGHALEGNLHFVFTQGFDDPAEVERYRRFMDAVCRMVVEKYDGSLKAEHGTGRNIAPFVELEWGSEAYGLMRALKDLFDPERLLNPGVILNDDPQAHLKNLKPMPACDPIVDKCIECGFCEPKCPSRGLTLSPRQRIVGWREITRVEAAGGTGVEALRGLYDYHGIDTCAACGLCATACPVGIETGQLILALRRKRATPLAHRVGQSIADHFGAVTTGLRAGLGTADAAHALLGTRVMKRTVDSMRSLSGGRMPKWSPTLPRPVRFEPEPSLPTHGPGDRVVYFPGCVTRNMGPQRGDDTPDPLPVVAERLFRKAGFDVVYPENLGRLCCGQPFDSQGLRSVAENKAKELEAALAAASEGGRYPIVFDTSPCAFTTKRMVEGRLTVLDSVEFLHQHVAPRLDFERTDEPVALHAVCSVRKMGTVEQLA